MSTTFRFGYAKMLSLWWKIFQQNRKELKASYHTKESFDLIKMMGTCNLTSQNQPQKIKRKHMKFLKLNLTRGPGKPAVILDKRGNNVLSNDILFQQQGDYIKLIFTKSLKQKHG